MRTLYFVCLIAVVALSSCDTLPPIDPPDPPEPPVTNDVPPVVVPPDSESTRGFLMTDWGQTPSLAKWREADAKKFKERGINTMFVVCDLAINQPGNRQYIAAARSERTVTPLLVDNIKLMRKWGFRVMLAMDNHPSARKGSGPWMAGLGYRDIRGGPALFSVERMANTKACYTDLFSKIPMSDVWGICLYLEVSDVQAISWCKQLAQWLRSQGYKGRLYYNGIGDAEWGGDAALDVRNTTGTNSKLLNGDGMDVNAGNAYTVVPEWVEKGKRFQDGWLLYYGSYIGKGTDRSKPAPMEEWMWKSIPLPGMRTGVGRPPWVHFTAYGRLGSEE